MTHAIGPSRWRSEAGTFDSLPVALADRRRAVPVQVRLLLPVSGDAGALRAEPAVVAEAVSCGAALVIEPIDPRPDDASVLLLATPGPDHEGPAAGASLVFTEHLLNHPVAAQADVATCARDLARAMAQAAEALDALDVGAGRAEAESELRRRERLLAAPPAGADPRAQQLLHRAFTVLVAVDLAQRAEGRAVSASELRLRGSALSDLGRAARRAIEAAVGPGWAGPTDPR
jgi:hypothetical protein